MLLTEGTNPKHSSLLTVIVCFHGGIRAEGVLDTAAFGPVVNPKLAKKLGSLKRRMKARISQADSGSLKGGTRVFNTSFKFLKQENYSSIDGLLDFSFDAEVLDIGQREMIIGLSWLQENDFCIDTAKHRTWRQSDNLNILCRERKIPPVEIISANDHFATDEMVIIIDIAI